jgi:hypothetical protein
MAVRHGSKGAVMTTRRWIDWVNVLLGLWLIAAPWILGSADGNSLAAGNSRSVGAALVMLGAFAMYKPSISGDAIGVIFGIWLIASPWILGLAELPAARTNGVIVGLLVIGYALWAMRVDATRSAAMRGLGTSYA